MSKFVITYLSNGKMPATPEEGQAHRAEWGEWLKGLGNAVIEPQNPFKGSKTIKADGSVTDGASRAGLMGYSVIEAADMDAAVEIAKSCPFMSAGMGDLEVSQIMDMG